MDRVVIYDTTLRDGEQAPGMSMTPAEKLRFARQLARLQVDIVEAGFPAASESEVAAVGDIAAELGDVITVSALARAEPDDIDAAGKAVAAADRRRIHTFIAVSDLHIECKLKSTREQVLVRACEAVRHALNYTEDVQFGLEDASRADVGFVCAIVEAAIEAGAGTVDVADTVGYVVPDEFGALIATLRQRVPNIDRAVISTHCHDDLGMAVANSLAGVANGARQIDCAVNGIGERAGNASLEEVVMALATRQRHYGVTTNIRTEELCPTSELLSEIVSVPVPPNKAVVGINAFAHEAGIHQHGVLVNPLTYEIMTPTSVGAASRMVLGKHSGRHALDAVLKRRGVRLAPDELTAAFGWMKDRTALGGTVHVDEVVDHVSRVVRPPLVDTTVAAQP